MDFAFSAEQEELRSVVARFLDAECDEATVRRLADSEESYDPKIWRFAGRQLGLQSLAIPEAYGGAGFTFLEEAVVFEEFGRRLCSLPYLATVGLAANALTLAQDAATMARWLPGIAAGETVATVAFTGDEGSWDLTRMTTIATRKDSEYSLRGHKSFVLDGQSADLILVTAQAEAGLSLYAVERGAAGLSVQSLSTLDRTRRQARLEFRDTPACIVGHEGQAAEVMPTLLDLGAVALSLEQVGGASFLLDINVAYAKQRFQFGRAIGSFQAIKHKCADMLLDVESARSAAYYAAWCAAEMNSELPAVASMAKALCSEVYGRAATDTILIHGGIGFTWEHPAHLYYRRAKSSELLLGDPSYHRELLAQRINI